LRTFIKDQWQVQVNPNNPASSLVSNTNLDNIIKLVEVNLIDLSDEYLHLINTIPNLPNLTYTEIISFSVFQLQQKRNKQKKPEIKRSNHFIVFKNFLNHYITRELGQNLTLTGVSLVGKKTDECFNNKKKNLMKKKKKNIQSTRVAPVVIYTSNSTNNSISYQTTTTNNLFEDLSDNDKTIIESLPEELNNEEKDISNLDLVQQALDDINKAIYSIFTKSTPC
ncbi:13512_t:CDS:2, partial [Dentiscutata heterogama]